MQATLYSLIKLHLRVDLSLILTSLSVLLFIAVLAPIQANAVPADSQAPDPVLAHCKNELSSRVQSACNKTKNIESPKNVATYKNECIETPTTERESCITKYAKRYITQANKKNPKDAADFEKELRKVLLDAAGGDAKKLNKRNDNVNINTGDSDQDSECKDGKCIDPAADPNVDCSKHACDLIKKYVNPFINLLSVTFGLIAVISIIMGGMQYAASTGDSQKVTQAKQRITNTLIAVVAYFFLYGFLQFLIPGGLFND